MAYQKCVVVLISCPCLACVCVCVCEMQGLADAFIKMRLPFESDEAAKLNREIFETIYFGAVNASVEVW